MSIRRRLNWLEEQLGRGRGPQMILILDGRDRPEQLEAARAHDGPLRIIRIGRCEMVDDAEEAERRLAELRAANAAVPSTIVGPDGTVLASWDPGLPWGLEDEE